MMALPQCVSIAELPVAMVLPSSYISRPPRPDGSLGAWAFDLLFGPVLWADAEPFQASVVGRLNTWLQTGLWVALRTSDGEFGRGMVVSVEVIGSHDGLRCRARFQGTGGLS